MTNFERILKETHQVPQVPAKLDLLVKEGGRRIRAIERRVDGHSAPEGTLQQLILPVTCSIYAVHSALKAVDVRLFWLYSASPREHRRTWGCCPLVSPSLEATFNKVVAVQDRALKSKAQVDLLAASCGSHCRPAS